MSEQERNYDHLRLKLAMRKKLLGLRANECHRSVLLHSFPWASLELFDAVVADCLQEGTLIERTGRNRGVVLVWIETAIKAQG